MRADKQAVTARKRKEQGARMAVLCSAAVGTDSPVWILKRGDWEEADCHDGGFRFFFSLRRFSCLTVSPSRVDSSDILWRKERGAPTIGSGYDCPAWQQVNHKASYQTCSDTKQAQEFKCDIRLGVFLPSPQLTLLVVLNSEYVVGGICHPGPVRKHEISEEPEGDCWVGLDLD